MGVEIFVSGLNRGLDVILTPIDKNNPRYFTKEIPRLEGPILRMLQGLYPYINNAEYSVLVGDDTSARIPTLILRKIINFSYKSHGIEPIATTFVQKRDKSKVAPQSIVNRVRRLSQERISQRPGTKALILTEYMDLGEGMEALVKIFRPYNIPYDIASLVLQRDEQCYEHLFGESGRIFHSDQVSDLDAVNKLFDKPELTGLWRKSSRAYPYPRVAIGDRRIRRSVAKARKDVDTLAKKLFLQAQLFF